MDLPRVIVFLRAPELGRVKTRLAATVGPTQDLTPDGHGMQLPAYGQPAVGTR